MSEQKIGFGKLGVILAAAGSAVGLGNIWKFPYMIGENGGAAFLLIYLLCVLVFGIPTMSAEMYVGRKGLKNWTWLRGLVTIAATFFFAFYLVVTAWCLQYLYLSVSALLGTSNILTSALNPEQLNGYFQNLTTNHLQLTLWILVAMMLTIIIELAGIKKGIERISKILMPTLFIILLLMIIRGSMLPGSEKGFGFLFEPDFSKITARMILSAMGQCFFSLSIGIGALATYASYMNKEQNLVNTSASIIGLDTIVAILSGMAIFPAVFALGIDPAEGPQLVFVTLPSVFSGIPGGYFLQTLFFLLLAIAAITSTISLMEVQLNFLTHKWHIRRGKGISVSALLVCLLAIVAVLSQSFFGWLDLIVSNFLLPAGGMLFAIYVGWKCPKEDVISAIQPAWGPAWISTILYNLIRFFIPTMILIIFINGLIHIQ